MNNAIDSVAMVFNSAAFHKKISFYFKPSFHL